MSILGIHTCHGDVSAVLLYDGEPLAAVEEAWCRQGKQGSVCPRDVITLRPLARVCGQCGEDVREEKLLGGVF